MDNIDPCKHDEDHVDDLKPPCKGKYRQFLINEIERLKMENEALIKRNKELKCMLNISKGEWHAKEVNSQYYLPAWFRVGV